MQDKLNDVGKLVLRLALGILILLHGVAKLTHGVGPIEGMLGGIGLPGYIAYGVFAGEVLGPLLLIAGFYARIGAALIAINMVFALVLAHSDELASLSEQGGWALELQGMFLFTAIALLLMGPGRISVNRR
ncbi:putative membrane protein [Thiobacillus denitrificans ATCC 25259]|uniref:Putative membrane protein n=1 Tax=Thiobacillus denitrificans (strain ATCC 25259 / T1) TaxID=292415 RepID=Q3SJY7_THIDA|nr:DoxX family protein [Thiobacillus denitrificans]AAZ97009.1 putative membrane protein [Thiobacillus denitrificans ATCC 25259]